MGLLKTTTEMGGHHIKAITWITSLSPKVKPRLGCSSTGVPSFRQVFRSIFTFCPFCGRLSRPSPATRTFFFSWPLPADQSNQMNVSQAIDIWPTCRNVPSRCRWLLFHSLRTQNIQPFLLGAWGFRVRLFSLPFRLLHLPTSGIFQRRKVVVDIFFIE